MFLALPSFLLYPLVFPGALGLEAKLVKADPFLLWSLRHHAHNFYMMMFCVSLILWGRGLHVAGTNGKGSVCAMTFAVCVWPAGGNSTH